MDKTKYVCAICGKEIDSLEPNALDSYVAHVKACAAKENAKIKAEEDKKRLEEVNAAINKVRTAKSYYEECLKDFKAKYPKEYDMNFASEDTEKEDDTLQDEGSNTKINSTVKVIHIDGFENIESFLDFIFGYN